MTIRVYNTLSKQKEPFETVEPGKVGIYLCGPTVYKESHIGHMVGPVIFDTIKRYLSYSGYDVTWVVNITDVDDKLIAQAAQRGVPMSQVACEMTMDYCANLLELGVDQITHMPRATEHMDEIVRFIGELIERRFAYAVDGDVFFDVPKDPQYGKLSNRAADQQQGEGGEAAGKKRSPGDFALWKAARPGEPSWDSPWGPGRPGWHIECSAMSRRLLGESFDIHGGGLDLVFPHHENEVAQSECCHDKPMARYWMHNGLMRPPRGGKVGGRAEADRPARDEDATDKISRSKGAGGLRALIQRQGGERLRFLLLRTHYRSTIVFSEEAIEEAGAALDKFYVFFDRYERILGRPFYLGDPEDDPRRVVTRREEGDREAGGEQGGGEEAGGEQGGPADALRREVRALRVQFLAKMDDDFNTGAATSELFNLLGVLNRFADEQRLEDGPARRTDAVEAFGAACERFRELAAILGLFLKAPAGRGGGGEALTARLVDLLIDLRAHARREKDFAMADRIRDGLGEAGITLEDRKEGTTWRID